MPSIFRIHTLSVRKTLRISGLVLVLFFIYILMRNVLADVLSVIFGAAVVCFIVDPIAKIYEKRLSRPIAVLAALLSLIVALGLMLWLLLPSLVAETFALSEALPASVRLVKSWLDRTIRWLENIFPGISIPSLTLGGEHLPEFTKGTIRFAGSIADLFYHLSLMIVLGYFFLCDRERMLIRLELLIPRSMRRTAVRMGRAVCRELMVYLRGQGLIAAIVGVLAAAGLYFVGVRSSLALGIIVGILNMIPYFGPVLGGIPAILMALGSGLQTAVFALAVLWIVQQIDSAVISPRIMSSVTGVSPATVLLSIFIGSGLGGIVGMLLAMPAVMAFRTVFRVFVQRYENV